MQLVAMMPRLRSISVPINCTTKMIIMAYIDWELTNDIVSLWQIRLRNAHAVLNL